MAMHRGIRDEKVLWLKAQITKFWVDEVYSFEWMDVEVWMYFS